MPIMPTLSHAQSWDERVDYTAYTSFRGSSFAVGMVLVPSLNRSGFSVGFDAGIDGKAMDNTFDSQGDVDNYIFFLSVGGSINTGSRSKILLLGLVGIRSVEENCPKGTNISYLGFRCYAGTKPEIEERMAVGFLTAFYYQRISGGVKVKTGGPIEIMLGFSF